LDAVDAARLPGNPTQFASTRLEYRDPTVEPEHHDPFAKLFSSPTSLGANGGYHSPANDSLVSRATYAASSIFVTRDDSGRTHPNTSYFLRVLASAVAHSAYRPYWRRSASQPFSEFGANIGNDAGMKVWHEFEPGILQLMRNHEPRFVSRISEHARHN
jgi:hypothetical protein